MPTAANVGFSFDELRYMIERFGQANEPIAQAIAQKAKKALDSVEGNS